MEGFGAGGGGGQQDHEDGEEEGPEGLDDEERSDLAAEPMVTLVKTDLHETHRGPEPESPPEDSGLAQGAEERAAEHGGRGRAGARPVD